MRRGTIRLASLPDDAPGNVPGRESPERMDDAPGSARFALWAREPDSGTLTAPCRLAAPKIAQNRP